jgi:Uncharacterized conserved protein (DUF2358)
VRAAGCKSDNGATTRRALLASTAAIVLFDGRGRAATLELKRTGLSDEQVKEILERSLAQGRYFINSAGMATEVFAEDCVFQDPTNETRSLRKYLAALDVLFDPHSTLTLQSIAVSKPRTITAQWTLGGYLKFPWKPFVPEFTGGVTYTLDETGLVVRQEETWGISPLEALRETFTPTPGPPK